jgi:hypothetical protein
VGVEEIVDVGPGCFGGFGTGEHADMAAGISERRPRVM